MSLMLSLGLNLGSRLLAGVSGPVLTQFAFVDDFNSNAGPLYLRSGWQPYTAVGNYIANPAVANGLMTHSDGFNSYSTIGQDIGRVDGGYVEAVWGASIVIPVGLAYNYIDRDNFMSLVMGSNNSRLQLKKRSAGVETTFSDLSQQFAIGDRLRTEWSWSSGTCTIKVYLNGALLNFNGAVNTFTVTGMKPTGVVGPYLHAATFDEWRTGHIGSTPLPRLAVDNLPTRVYQRHKTTNDYPITLTGACSGVSGIQWRLTKNGAAVSGWDWGQKAATSLTIAAGRWTLVTPRVPQGDFYRIEVRATNDNMAATTSRPFGVGMVIITNGQSLGTPLGTTGAITQVVPAGGYIQTGVNQESGAGFDGGNFYPPAGRVFNEGNSAQNTIAGALCAGILASAPADLPVMIVPAGKGANLLTSFLPSSTLKVQNASNQTLWEALTNTMTTLTGGDFEGMAWDQGQQDAGWIGANAAETFTPAAAITYRSNLAGYVQNLKDLTGRDGSQFKFVAMLLGRANYTPGAYARDAAWLRMKSLYNDMADPTSPNYVPGFVVGGTTVDLERSDSNPEQVHLSTNGYGESARRAGYAVARAKGFSSIDRRGPIATGMARAGNTLAVTYDMQMSTALTCTASVATNLLFFTDSTLATPLAAPAAMSISGNVATFTFASAPPAGTAMIAHYGIAPDVATALYGTQPDGKSVIAFPITKPVVAA